jgi:cytochrome c oxidase subunit I
MRMIKKAALLLLLAVVINAILYAFIWAHHTLVTGLNPFLGSIFLIVSLLIVVAVIFFCSRWIARQSLRLTPAMAFFFGLFVLLVGDLINTVFVGTSTLDIQLHDTYFVIAHVHLLFLFGMLFLGFAAVYFFFSTVTGKTLNAPMGYIHFAFTLMAIYFICWPFNYAGLAGMPRRYIDYSGWVNSYRFSWVNVYAFSGVNQYTLQAMFLFVCGQVVFLVNLIWSVVKGRRPAVRA